MRVKDKYRTNPLSLEPGGNNVTVNYADGKSFEYDKVKKPGAYIRRISLLYADRGDISEILIDGVLAWARGRNLNQPWEI